MLMAEGQPDEVSGISEKLKRREKIQLCEAIHVRKDGKRIHVAVSLSPVKEVNGSVVGFVAITREIRSSKAAPRSRDRRRDKASV